MKILLVLLAWMLLAVLQVSIAFGGLGRKQGHPHANDETQPPEGATQRKGGLEGL